ncbi:hypothetical protein [Azospirillum brasilense]|uniref:hypothetical protein n=1 Tax=Azospirillum brasilense TaxID=192 RepID=UPI0011AB0EE3|nr:hypothetical protein [Azospirillum brasilense]
MSTQDLMHSTASKIKFRPYGQTDDIEKSLAEWISEDVFPGRHGKPEISKAMFSKQYLFIGDKSLQNIIVIPSNQADYPNFYIVHLESTDNPSVIGDNMLSRPMIYIHKNWTIDGAIVLSSVIDEIPVYYIWADGAYVEHRPG